MTFKIFNGKKYGEIVSSPEPAAPEVMSVSKEQQSHRVKVLRQPSASLPEELLLCFHREGIQLKDTKTKTVLLSCSFFGIPRWKYGGDKFGFCVKNELYLFQTKSALAASNIHEEIQKLVQQLHQRLGTGRSYCATGRKETLSYDCKKLQFSSVVSNKENIDNESLLQPSCAALSPPQPQKQAALEAVGGWRNTSYVVKSPIRRVLAPADGLLRRSPPQHTPHSALLSLHQPAAGPTAGLAMLDELLLESPAPFADDSITAPLRPRDLFNTPQQPLHHPLLASTLASNS